ncbi:MAG TPA: DUF3828 domain-containing protein [Thermoanaerobaculia bacterium]|nr:DUF3828 domain-containing protein [Thermoanaerobaculia bacterium]
MRTAIAFLLAITLLAGCTAKQERPAAPSDDDALIAAARAYVAKESVVPSSKITVSGKSGDYVRLQVEAVDGQTDPATVFMKRVNGTWTGLSLGTGFPPDDLRALGIPEALWDKEAPDAVVSDLYKAHEADQSPFFQTAHRDRVDRYFEPALADLIWKDAVSSAGEVGAIDFDPLYDAQDVAIANLAVQPAEVTAGSARVLVTFENHGTREQIAYSLAQSAGAWKIADVTYRDGRTLRGILTSS